MITLFLKFDKVDMGIWKDACRNLSLGGLICQIKWKRNKYEVMLTYLLQPWVGIQYSTKQKPNLNNNTKTEETQHNRI